MEFNNLNSSIQRALIVASKFGFISKDIFWKFLTKPNLSYKYEVWNKLLATGFLKEFNRLGIDKSYYSLSKKGLTFLNDAGFEKVCQVHPLHIEHDEIVMNFTLGCEQGNLILQNWLTDRLLRQSSPARQLELTGSLFDKLPDLFFALNVERSKINCVLEVERTRKNKARYDHLVLSYAKKNSLNLVVIAYNDRYVRKSILASMKRLGYPQGSKPIVFCRIKDILEQPHQFEIEVGENKISLNQYVKNIQSMVSKRPENQTIKNSAQNSGEFKEVA